MRHYGASITARSGASRLQAAGKEGFFDHIAQVIVRKPSFPNGEPPELARRKVGLLGPRLLRRSFRERMGHGVQQLVERYA